MGHARKLDLIYRRASKGLRGALEELPLVHRCVSNKLGKWEEKHQDQRDKSKRASNEVQGSSIELDGFAHRNRGRPTSYDGRDYRECDRRRRTSSLFTRLCCTYYPEANPRNPEASNCSSGRGSRDYLRLLHYARPLLGVDGKDERTVQTYHC